MGLITGAGSISYDGTPAIQAGSLVLLSGARVGIDGTYRVKTCTDVMNSSGYNGSCTVDFPQGEAGKDGR